jgi:hypothetical protein
MTQALTNSRTRFSPLPGTEPGLSGPYWAKEAGVPRQLCAITPMNAQCQEREIRSGWRQRMTTRRC